MNRVRLGGIKFWLDGSLETAWMTQPSAANPPGKTAAFRGFQQLPSDVLACSISLNTAVPAARVS